MRPVNVPEREIRFAAKTGFLSKGLWQEFFVAGSASWKRRLWKSFLERGFFRPHPSSLAGGVFVLTRKSPVVVRLVGDEISSPPYISQLEHDETVARILLELMRSRAIDSFQIEMELKRKFDGERRFHDGTDRLKYPDAIVEVGGRGSKVRIALELELTRKDPKRYRQCVGTYASRADVSKVIFVVRSTGIADSIRRAMRETYYPDWERPIGFGSLEDWKENPAKAVIQFGEKSMTLEQIRRELAA